MYVPMYILYVCIDREGEERNLKKNTKTKLRVCEYRKGNFEEHT